MNENSKHSHISWERKYLLKHLPDLIEPKTPKKLIQDHYLINTSLLLRQVSSPSGVIYILRKKYPPEPENLSKFHITNIDLEAQEYQNLLSLPAYQFHKTRYILEIGNCELSIDRMVLNLQEILITKAVFDDEASWQKFQLPFSSVKEVTSERAFTGFEIARQHWTSMNY